MSQNFAFGGGIVGFTLTELNTNNVTNNGDVLSTT